MKKTLSLIFCVLALLSSMNVNAQTADFNVVPRPASIIPNAKSEAFVLNAQTVIVCEKNKASKRNARFLQQYIAERSGLNLVIKTKAPASNFIQLEVHSYMPYINNADAYVLNSDERHIDIQGVTDAGVFYGIQTLRKALPHIGKVIGARTAPKTNDVVIPAVSIQDSPRFAYRGGHLDTSRHYVTTDSIRRFIDMLALHNINRFHWHITDDQGWRLEIKKYPRLVEVGSKRSETVIGHNSGVYDGKPYGGYYTQKECKELVKYAEERNIVIVPEIDMPGHMLGALAAYPELGCTGGPYDVWTIWGVSEDVLCAGNDKTLKFIDDVLDEVVKIFPSEYIHVGGDECPKTRWKTCPKCQARIKANGLEAKDGHTAEERLQSYVIRHAEAHLASLGRKMIGWDETLEGGLAEGATVMSWRGEAGGIEAAKQHHDVIMTPNSYLYFDYYQSLDTKNEPDAIGGYLPLDRVYSYEPVPDALLKQNLGEYIIGVQANCWTEYMPTYSQMEYMELPRMAALADIQWTARDTKDYADFCRRTINLLKVYDEQGYNYARHIFDVQPTFTTDTDSHCIVAELNTVDGAQVRYTLDGSPVHSGSTIYHDPLEIRENAQLRFAAFRPGLRHVNSAAPQILMSHAGSKDITFSKATAQRIVLLQEPNDRYTYNGALNLVDGVLGNTTNFGSGQWIGFTNNDLEALVDLGSEQEISSISINTLVGKGDWIFDARDFTLSIPADSTVTFESLASAPFQQIASEQYPAMKEKDADGIFTHSLSFEPVKTRYIKVRMASEHALPEWHGGRGKPGFLFVDEIIVK